ncbi:MAG: methyl-accepting chemotaxis protein [Solirubrobacteraceae bacterium]
MGLPRFHTRPKAPLTTHEPAHGRELAALDPDGSARAEQPPDPPDPPDPPESPESPESPEAAPETLAPARELRLDVISTSLSETRPVCDVLSAQLDAVLDETETAALGFIDRVESIDTAVDRLEHRMQELVSRTDRQAVVLEEMARDNAAAVEDLRRFIEERNQTVRALVEEVRSLERFGRSIRDVSSTSKVLAINALIEAAHAGEAGAGFGIVAHHIQDLARVSDTAAQELERGIEDLTGRILDELGARSKDTGAGSSNQFEQHLGALADGQAALVEHVTDVRRAVEDADGATHEVAGLASGIADNVQFQDITRQATEQIQRALGRLGDHSELLIAYVDGREPLETVQQTSHALDDMVNEYVIQRQRATHAEIALGNNGVTTQDGPTIELF